MCSHGNNRFPTLNFVGLADDNCKVVSGFGLRNTWTSTSFPQAPILTRRVSYNMPLSCCPCRTLSGTYRGSQLSLFPQERGTLCHFDQGIVRRLHGITGGGVRSGGALFYCYSLARTGDHVGCLSHLSRQCLWSTELHPGLDLLSFHCTSNELACGCYQPGIVICCGCRIPYHGPGSTDTDACSCLAKNNKQPDKRGVRFFFPFLAPITRTSTAVRFARLTDPCGPDVKIPP